MGRAPCCEKMGLKKGPWTPEEDQILINYIHLYGHGNWRALPKQAGLLRCGKSCRLRWTNYLRPDIKRGNFTREEEETIIELHEMLGNRWSAIAAKLPGRTDNEIKNVWHTHLKKRLKNTNNNHATSPPKRRSLGASHIGKQQKPINSATNSRSDNSQGYGPVSPQQSFSEISSSAATTTTAPTMSDTTTQCIKMDSGEEDFPEMDDNFWSEVLSSNNSGAAAGDAQLQFPFSPLAVLEPVHSGGSYNSYDMDMEFWYNIFTRSGESHELPEI